MMLMFIIEPKIYMITYCNLQKQNGNEIKQLFSILLTKYAKYPNTKINPNVTDQIKMFK